jgi:hypothetical protein
MKHHLISAFIKSEMKHLRPDLDKVQFVTTHTFDYLGFNEVDLSSLVFSIEENWRHQGLSIDDESYRPSMRVGDFINMIEELIA